jgi:uncharacterized membrane protein
MKKLISTDSHTPAAARSQFAATLVPHYYLPPTGFLTLLFNLAGLSYLSIFTFFFLGVRWLAGLWCLDIAVSTFVYFWKYAPGRLAEEIVLTREKLSVTRTAPSGKAECWDFNPYWVRFELKKRGDLEGGQLLLSSHGRTLAFGAFLSDQEKVNFAAALGSALEQRRSTYQGGQSARG